MEAVWGDCVARWGFKRFFCLLRIKIRNNRNLAVAAALCGFDYGLIICEPIMSRERLSKGALAHRFLIRGRRS